MATSTKWRINVTANNGDANFVGIGDLELRSSVGVARPFVRDGFSAVATNTGAANMLGVAALSTIVASYEGDTWYQLTFPFNVIFGGVTYTTCIVSSYGHIYFGGAGNPDGWESDLSGNRPPFPSIVHGDDNGSSESSFHALYAGTEGTTYRIRLEMNGTFADPGPADTVWEVTFDSTAPNEVRLDFLSSAYANPISGIGDGYYAEFVETFSAGVVNQGYDLVTTETFAEGAATASTESAPAFGISYGAEQGCDNTTEYGWLSATGNTTGWLQYEFDSTFAVAQYVVSAPSNVNFSALSHLAQDWTLEYWDGAGWSVVDTQTGQTGWTYSQARTFTPAPPSNDGDITLPEFTVDGLVGVPNYTFVGGTLSMLPPTMSGTVLLAAAYNGDVSLLAPTLSGVSIVGRAMHGDAVLPDPTLAGALDGALPLPLLTLDAAGHAGTAAAGAATLLRMTMSGSMDAPLALPELSVSGFGIANDAPLPLPELAVDASGLAGTASDGDLALLALTADGDGLTGMLGSGAIDLPQLLAAGDSGAGADIALPELGLGASGFAGAIGAGSALLPKLGLSGDLRQDGEGDGAVSISALTLDAAATSAAAIAGAVTLDGLVLDGVAFAGNTSVGSLTLPLWSVSAGGHSSVIGSATVMLPVLALDGVLVATVAAPVFTGVVLNTRTNAATTYSGGAFNSLCNFNGLVLAATSTGIVALTGDTDRGAQIDATLTSGVSDFKSDKLKRVIAGYAGYRASGDMELTLITDEHHETIYRIEPRQIASDIHPSRVKFGRGVSGLYWQWRLANKSGADFSLDSLRLDAEVLSRRV